MNLGHGMEYILYELVGHRSDEGCRLLACLGRSQFLNDPPEVLHRSLPFLQVSEGVSYIQYKWYSY